MLKKILVGLILVGVVLMATEESDELSKRLDYFEKIVLEGNYSFEKMEAYNYIIEEYRDTANNHDRILESNGYTSIKKKMHTQLIKDTLQSINDLIDLLENSNDSE